ncbi:peptidoglycan editing factor PgeF [Methylonatrum kenyense]|uniref:peptidoglycan editing factor PgeF n=1 Tax=Methylonatrum kenyense TaxID=455253 RepID=UPI0020BE8572|nr:peptidoglycan editing factor PgeF [Methylonatrum kenyense]MCK8517177.1 peptidoglycan editing factor PgeF [Methylonatrum kenyense]
MTPGFIRPFWPAPANVRALVSTRKAGDARHWRDGSESPPRAAGLPAEPVWLTQVHGTAVVAAHDQHDAPPAADAAWTDQPRRVCAVLTADCLPVLFCDRQGNHVAAAHAGWRGLLNGVLERTVDAMGCPSAELLAWMGPAIGPKAFEVGPEVRDAFLQRDPGCTAAFLPGDGDHWYADLYRLARRRLNGLGVRDVRGGGFCTVNESERFYSYRREGEETGRMGAFIWLAE